MMRELLKKISIAVAISALALCGCEKDAEENSSQREEIETYLESTHTPKLIAEADLASSFDEDPPFYTRDGKYSYRYISTYYDTDRESKSEVLKGSKITITFDLYPFSGSEISDSELPIYTNKATDQLRLEEAGLNTEYEWDFTPMTFTIGGKSLLKGIDELLIGCREGDEVEIYMTLNMAYGNTIVGTIEKGSAMRFRCSIEGVEN